MSWASEDRREALSPVGATEARRTGAAADYERHGRHLYNNEQTESRARSLSFLWLNLHRRTLDPFKAFIFAARASHTSRSKLRAGTSTSVYRKDLKFFLSIGREVSGGYYMYAGHDRAGYFGLELKNPARKGTSGPWLRKSCFFDMFVHTVSVLKFLQLNAAN